MKRLFILLTSLHLCLSSWGEGIIPLYNNEDDVRDQRSINLEPVATIDENLLSIDTAPSVSYVQVVIKDSIGSVVYFGYDGTTSRSHTFTVGELPEGSYTLEVLIGDCTYYGEFTN